MLKRILFLILLFPLPLQAAVFTVTHAGDAPDENTGDGVCEATDAVGDCTLRAAIQQANASAGSDVIAFQISGSAPFVIRPQTPLAAVSDLVIDGTTQPGFAGKPLVTIDGSMQSGGGRGLVVGSETTVKGIGVRNFADKGIEASGSFVVIQGCYIGTDETGTAAAPNKIGVFVTGPNGALIGGDGPGEGNVISGNEVGIRLSDADNNDVVGNKIGTDAAGTGPLPNDVGVDLALDSDSNRIGGERPGDGNVISGNRHEAISLSEDADVNWILANRVGTDASGDFSIPNGTTGVGDSAIRVRGAGNYLGGADAGEANFIVGNRGDGLRFSEAIYNGAQGNIIASNSGNGVTVDNGSEAIAIVLNFIDDNGGLGIDLGCDGPTLNDTNDGDLGANSFQNFPVIESAESNGCGQALIQGTLQSTPNTVGYRVEYYWSSQADPSGYGEGGHFLEFWSVNTDASGTAALELEPTEPLPVGSFVSATALSGLANTSEFSRAVAVTPLVITGQAGTIAFVAGDAAVSESAASVEVVLQRNCGFAGEVSVDVSTSDGTAAAGEDYRSVSQTVTFAEGEWRKAVAIPLIGDDVVEGDETFSVTIGNPSGGGGLANAQMTLTITDDDAPPPATTGGTTGEDTGGTTGGGSTGDGTGSTAGGTGSTDDSSPVSGGCSLIGANDFRVSAMGPDGNTAFFGMFPAVVYNPVQGEFFAVWAGTDDTGSLVSDEIEIYGQRMDGVTGALVGPRLRLSDVGTDGDPGRNVVVGQGITPAVAYNSRDGEYLVVWLADDDDLADGEQEVFGQRVDASSGAEVGENDFQISFMGTNGDTSYFAYFPSVAYDASDNEYLVAWVGVAPSQAANADTELYGQRIGGSDGVAIGPNRLLRVPDAAREAAGNVFAPLFPDVAYNSENNEYLIVFSADLFADNDIDIFAQRVDASTGDPLGTEFRVSDMGTEAFPGEPFSGTFPKAAYNATDNQYLVVWSGADRNDKETDIYGQRLDGETGQEIGADDFRISAMGPEGSIDFGVVGACGVAYNAANREYLVVWDGDHDQEGLIDDEIEVFAQRLDATDASPIGGMTRVSDLQGTGNVDGEARFLSVAYNPRDQNYLIVWDGDDDVSPLVDDEFEIFGQLLSDTKCGNGVVEEAESCDDGNVAAGDGCSSVCVTEAAVGSTGGSGGGATAGTGSADSDASGGCTLLR